MEKSILRFKVGKFVDTVYKLTDNFPPEEKSILTSQLRRAVLSIPANVVEGYTRRSCRTFKYHLEVAYRSLEEAKYFINFACRRGYIEKKEHKEVISSAEEISRMIWCSIETLSKR